MRVCVLSHNRDKDTVLPERTRSHLRTTFFTYWSLNLAVMRIGGILVARPGGHTMWVAVEVNVALWGMILCALQAAQHWAS